MVQSLHAIIKKYGLLKNHKRSKRYGQNFLTNPVILENIASLIRPNHLPIVEIGPGPGGLTRALLQTHTPHVYAIEIDPHCLDALNDFLGDLKGNRFTPILLDALSLNPDHLMVGPYHIVGNLPYNIATPLIIKWLTQSQNVESITVMVQKEVALRMTSKPGIKTYGRLSILVQTLSVARICKKLSPGSFFPKPSVDSAVVSLEIKKNRDFNLIPRLEKLTQIVFSKRRKMLRSVLPEVSGFDPCVRAETLSPENFFDLARQITP